MKLHLRWTCAHREGRLHPSLAGSMGSKPADLAVTIDPTSLHMRRRCSIPYRSRTGTLSSNCGIRRRTLGDALLRRRLVLLNVSVKRRCIVLVRHHVVHTPP